MASGRSGMSNLLPNNFSYAYTVSATPKSQFCLLENASPPNQSSMFHLRSDNLSYAAVEVDRALFSVSGLQST